MRVVIDTSVVSLALRRAVLEPRWVRVREEFAELVREGRAVLLGPVRQEVLSGVKTKEQFSRLRERLRAFDDVAIVGADYETAAEWFNQCRGKGVQGSNTDFLICAVGWRLEAPILTTDRDFERFARVLPVALHAPRG